MTQIVMPMHTNGVAGAMFDGIMMEWIDVCAGVAAMRHAHGAVVTASIARREPSAGGGDPDGSAGGAGVLPRGIDRLDFLSPVRVGEIVVLQAMVNYAARTSMEVGCRVETEDMRTQSRRYVTKAYLTFVAIDDGGRPRPIPPLTLDTDDAVRRHAQAETRRRERLRAAGRLESSP